MKKTKEGTQPFREICPFNQKDSANVALKISDPEIRLEGQDVVVTHANLDHAKVDINQKAYAAILSAINLVKLKAIFQKSCKNRPSFRLASGVRAAMQ